MLVPSPSPTDLIADAEDLAVVAARCAPQSETERRLSGDVVEALRASGFAAHFVPAAHGGKEGTFTELSEAVARVGQSCAATAWCASLVANLGRMAGLLPAAGQAEVWAAGPGTVVVGSLAPTGMAERVTGGWQVSGAWPYISAVDFSDWALLCARVPADGPAAARMFAVPRSAYQIADTWSNVGMSGTGSNTVTLEATVVPEARSFDRQNLFTGTPAASTAACHVVPLLAVNGLSFVTPVLGAARGAQRAWTAYVGDKIRGAAARPGAPAIERGPYDLVLARASGEIDAAELLVRRAAQVADQGAGITPLEVSRNLRDCSLAMETVVTAVNRLFRAAGTSGHTTGSPVQRVWRDVNSAASHIAVQFEPAAAAYATQVFKI
ncbi:hydrolase [Micromonospora sp. NPDC048898]|uniref:hydrolase n=1 Tax=Micromonospora sp. NPDC048898 TaxID=3364260 RepID=UPI00371D1201